MLNLKDVTGVESSPISKSILENSLGNSILKDSRAYANYEFLLSSIQNGSFKAPSVIFASGDGTFYPKNTAYQGDFYSANILARDGYTNSWMTSYGTDENFNLSYYDGSKLFKSLSIDPSTGKGKIRSLEVRNGNLPGQAGFVQFLLGFNESASTNDNGKYRHNFRTRHSTTSNSENAIDIFLWDYVNDSANAVGSRRVFSLYGTGSVEIVSGTQIFGPVSIAITTTEEKTIEQSTLAQTGKGVIYYNQSKNRFRYSENGGLFKYFGGGGDSSYESAPLVNCSTFRHLGGDLNAPRAIGAYFFAKEAIEISAISTVIPAIESQAAGDIQFAIYKPQYTVVGGNAVPMVGIGANMQMEKVASGFISPANAANIYASGILADSVTIQGWYCVVLTNTPAASWPSIYASANFAEMCSILTPSEEQYQVPLQFVRDDIVNPNEQIPDMWPETINSLWGTSEHLISKTIVPYIRVETA